MPLLMLLVGRVTTIKLAYWLGVGLFEALALGTSSPFEERFRFSVAFAAVATAGALLWAYLSARAPDRRVGSLSRTLPMILTTFAVSAVITSPASLPLLLIERQRSFESCADLGTCHVEAIVLWAALFVAGTLLIPLAFALSLPRPRLPSA